MTPNEVETTMSRLQPYLDDRKFLRGFETRFGKPEVADFPILFRMEGEVSEWVIFQKLADLDPYLEKFMFIELWIPLKEVLDTIASLESGQPCLASIRRLDYLWGWHWFKDKDIQLLLRELNQDTLIKALLVEIPEMQDKVISIMPPQAGKQLAEDIRVLKGKVPISESYDACKRISEIIARLVKDGLIFQQEQSPGISRKIRGEDFCFEDIQFLDQLMIRRLTGVVLPEVWAVALKGTSSELKGKVFAEMPRKIAKSIEERMNEMGPIRLSLAETSQSDVLETLERLLDPSNT